VLTMSSFCDYICFYITIQ